MRYSLLLCYVALLAAVVRASPTLYVIDQEGSNYVFGGELFSQENPFDYNFLTMHMNSLVTLPSDFTIIAPIFGAQDNISSALETEFIYWKTNPNQGRALIQESGFDAMYALVASTRNTIMELTKPVVFYAHGSSDTFQFMAAYAMQCMNASLTDAVNKYARAFPSIEAIRQAAQYCHHLREDHHHDLDCDISDDCNTLITQTRSRVWTEGTEYVSQWSVQVTNVSPNTGHIPSSLVIDSGSERLVDSWIYNIDTDNIFQLSLVPQEIRNMTWDYQVNGTTPLVLSTPCVGLEQLIPTVHTSCKIRIEQMVNSTWTVGHLEHMFVTGVIYNDSPLHYAYYVQFALDGQVEEMWNVVPLASEYSMMPFRSGLAPGASFPFFYNAIGKDTPLSATVTTPIPCL